MTQSILENELVKKYFGSCEHGAYLEKGCLCRLSFAENVINAMQEKIKKGERYLFIEREAYFDVLEGNRDGISCDLDNFHPIYLRLPDRFQPPERKSCEAHVLGVYCLYCDFKNPGAIKPPSTAGCDHSGLKRYCGDAIYCETCKFDISKEMAKCTLPVPHDGPCKKPDPAKCECENLICDYCVEKGGGPKKSETAKGDAVEAQIMLIKKNWWCKNTDELDSVLRKLVAFARNEEGQ